MENDASGTSPPAPSAGASEDASPRAAKAALWETWWFEARNADALAVLAKMPDADVDARTKIPHRPQGETAVGSRRNTARHLSGAAR